MIHKILVLCLGNICRSPIGHVLFQAQARAKGLRLEVDSAGLTAMVGEPANAHSITLMQQQGIDLRGHIAKQITTELVKWADLILVMDEAQKKMLEAQFPAACGKTYRLGHHSNFDIPDPYLQPFAAFEATSAQITQGVGEWLRFIE
jgi:protein-tyrosine phosphatase